MTAINSKFNFASWPPNLTNKQVSILTLQATTYAISHGLLYLPPGYPMTSPAPQAAIHAPLSLFPAPFPRDLFENTQELQRLYNVLYARIAMDTAFLDEVMGAEQGVGKVDTFIGELWRGWKALRDEGAVSQPLHLGLFRSDYLLHVPSNSDESEYPISLKQVEFNTISVSFGCLSQRIAELHRYLTTSTSYFNVSPYLKSENFPVNDTIAGLAEGLAEAHRAYVSSGGSKSARILFVVQPGERNVFDQSWLEYELLEKQSIHVLRQTFSELKHSASVDPVTSFLQISPLSSASPSPNEISVVYYRSGYMPHEYPDPSYYRTRFLLERSKAIKCPTIPLQLAGGKKVQEVLGRKGMVERFLGDKSREEIEGLRRSFMDMWSLDEVSNVGLGSVPTGAGVHESVNKSQEPLGTIKARSEHLSLVLKPQREGGGNNVYKEDIPAFLNSLPEEEREAWIAMRLIEVPKGIQGWLIRAGSLDYASQGEGKKAGEEKIVKTEVVSELGVFGWALFGQDVVKAGDGQRIEEREVGWLVRTKGKDSNEGGVATGFSVLDSVILVD